MNRKRCIRGDLYYEPCFFNEFKNLNEAKNRLDYNSRLLSISMFLHGAIDGDFLNIGGKVVVPAKWECNLTEETYNDGLLCVAAVGCIPVSKSRIGYCQYEAVPIPLEVEKKAKEIILARNECRDLFIDEDEYL